MACRPIVIFVACALAGLAIARPAEAAAYHADGNAGATPDRGIPPNPLSYSLDLGVQAGGGVNFNYGPGVHAAADSEADGFGVHSHTYSQLILPSVSGSYSAGATATATATFSDMTVKGPVGSMVSTSLNMKMTGSLLHGSGIDAGSYDGDAETQAVISVYVNGTFVGAGGVYERIETRYGTYVNDTGMLSAWGAGNTGIVTPNFMVQSGVPFEVRLTLTTSAYTLLSSANSTGGTAEANTDFSHTLAFALDGPVFNLPSGYTADSADAHIVNNSFIVPEPSSLVLALFGISAVLLVRRPQRLDQFVRQQH